MAIKSGIFNSVNGDRKYRAEDFAEYFATFIANGVFPNPSTGFQVISNDNMTVNLMPGAAWINGYYITSDANYNLAIDVADGVLNRIDRVVLQLNYLNRDIIPVVKKGTFASSPVAPVLKRDSDVYELALADIYIGKGAISITQSNITDLRLNNDLCGIVHGLVDQVDTATLYNQYQTWIAEKKAQYDQDIVAYTTQKQGELDSWYTTTTTDFETEFNTWFATIQNILDTNVAANLLNMIGDVALLETVAKDNLVNAVNEVNSLAQQAFQSASDGKVKLATAITGKGVDTSSSDTFDTMANNIETISTSRYDIGSKYSTFELMQRYGFDPLRALGMQ